MLSGSVCNKFHHELLVPVEEIGYVDLLEMIDDLDFVTLWQVYGVRHSTPFGSDLPLSSEDSSFIFLLSRRRALRLRSESHSIRRP